MDDALAAGPGRYLKWQQSFRLGTLIVADACENLGCPLGCVAVRSEMTGVRLLYLGGVREVGNEAAGTFDISPSPPRSSAAVAHNWCEHHAAPVGHECFAYVHAQISYRLPASLVANAW
jgi:hypothetical protein